MTGSDWQYTPEADTADDLQERARQVLPPDVFDWVLGGAGDERTVAANRAGFGRYRLLPRLLTNVASVDLSVDVVGTRFGAPVFASPTGGIGLVRKDSEVALARAAAAADVGFVLSTAASTPLEDVAVASGPARWFQLYWQADPMIVEDLVSRAQGAGFRAVVLAVDGTLTGLRRRMLRRGFVVPAELTLVNLQRYTDTDLSEALRSKTGRTGRFLPMGWAGIEWLRSILDVPLLLKGIMTARDAVRAIDAGVDGIIVSNHGGRRLDGMPGTIEVLEHVVAAVNGRVPVLMDGGVRTATDIAVALGLGATAVGLGRPVVWALACGGEAVVEGYLADLVLDLSRTFALLGVASPRDVTRDLVSRRDEFLTDAALVRSLSVDRRTMPADR